MKKDFLQETLMALSLSNLLFITSWRRLLYPAAADYHIQLEPSALDYMSVMLNVIITASIILGGLWFSRFIFKGKTPGIVKYMFLGMFGVVINGIRVNFLWNSSDIYLKIGGVAILLAFALFAWRKLDNQIFNYAHSILIILSPFVFMTFSQAVIAVINSTPVTETPFSTQLSAVQTNAQKTVKGRVIWIIFDELDYFDSFAMPASIVDLPEFEKLKKESLFATEALPPAHTTLKSLPSLITGNLVENTEYQGKRDLLLFYKNQPTGNFSEKPNIFSEIRAMGGNTALVGWYHPYCQVLGKDLSACHGENFDTSNDSEDKSFLNSVLRNFTECLNIMPFTFQWSKSIQDSLKNLNYAKRHFRMMNAATAAVSEKNIDLVFLHLPFPHYPYLYDRQSKSFGIEKSYFDNLGLADDALGKIRESMEKEHLWDNSVIIVSSDHSLRVNLYRSLGWMTERDMEITKGVEYPQVPFFIKLPGQKESITYSRSFNTVITSDLILALMKNEVTTPEDVKKWLDNHSD